MKRISLMIITILALALSPSGIFEKTAYAACPDTTTSKGQVLQGAGKAGDCDPSGVTKLVSSAVEILSLIVGIAAVIIIIYSGLKYITSGGDSGRVSSAKSTLIYALIGLAIAVLAQFLVHFVISRSDTIAQSCQAGYHRSSDGKSCIKD